MNSNTMRKKYTKLTDTFIKRLVLKITDKATPNNAEFDFYKRHIILSSGTTDYVAVNVTFCGEHNEKPLAFASTLLQFSFDFRTLELVYGYGNYSYESALRKSFEEIYNNTFCRVTLKTSF